jgi:hypothetical protein
MEDGKRRSQAGQGNVQPLCKHTAPNNALVLTADSRCSALASGNSGRLALL